MHWSHHIQAMCTLQHNLSKYSSHVKANAYLTIVRPSLEYAACVWDPYYEYLI